MNVSELIKKSLLYYDNKNLKYEEYLVNVIAQVNETSNSIIIKDLDDSVIKLESEYEILGIFDNQTNVWCWAWLVPYLSYNETIISRKLMEYALKLDPNTNTKDHYYIKSQLLNSRIAIENSFELEIHLALSSYLIKDLFKFIFPSKFHLNSNKTKFITIFYLIK
jgi:hypothetical protein